MIKRTVSLFFILTVFLYASFSVVINASAQSKQDIIAEFGFNVNEKAGAVYLYHYESDRVLFSRGSTDIVSPASTAKMMTGLLVCEIYHDKLDLEIVLDENMLDGITGTSMNLKTGMTVTIRDLLLGTVCGGNNDAAQALAIACTGSIKAFVEEMNIFAKRLYMNDTVYKNPTGLDAEGAVTTLADTVRLAHKAADNDLYVSISSASSFEFCPQGLPSVTIYNRNALASQFSATGYTNKYASGLIAGNTDAGGYVLATYAQKEDDSYLCVIMGAELSEGKIYSYLTANELLNTVFKKYSFVKIANAGDEFLNHEVKFSVSDGEIMTIPCVIAEDTVAFLNADTDLKNDITYKSYLHNTTLEAPISMGDVVGGVDFYVNGVIVANAPLVAAEDVEANGILLFLDNVKKVIIGRFTMIWFLISVILIVVYTYCYEKNSRHKKVGTVRFNKFS